MVQRGAASASSSWSRMYPVASGRPWAATCRAVLPVPSAAQQILPRASRRMAGSGRPFRVLGLQQIAVGAESKADLRMIWQVRMYVLQMRAHAHIHTESA